VPFAASGGPTSEHESERIAGYDKESLAMNIALLIVIVVAIVLAIVGGLNAAFQWLLWVALIVGILALIAFLFRVLSGNKRA
jgi:uncharacterized Tic20 family protein